MKRWSLSPYLVVVAAACSNTNPGLPSADMTAGSMGSSLIGAAGGSVGLADGTRIDLPAGAVTAPILITIVASAHAPLNAVGPTYLFGPEGTTFAKPIAVTLPYLPAMLPAGATAANLSVSTAPAGSSTFTSIGGTPTDATHVAALTSHFSQFAVTVAQPDADLGVALPDAGAPFDATTPSESAVPADVISAHGSLHKFVLTSVTMPQVKTDFAIDLNGDGRVDNQFGNINGALASQKLSPQMSVDTAIQSGQSIHLLAVQTADATLQQDTQVGATLSVGRSQANPDYSGAGTFTIDGAFAPGATYGGLFGGLYNSNNPPTTLHPATVTLRLPFLGTTPVTFTLHGAHIDFRAGAGKIMQGEIQGAMKKSDVQSTIIPSLAVSFTSAIQAGSSNALQLKQIFDVGDGMGGSCTNPDGSKGMPNDNLISVCEVSGNSLIANVLAPDVQMYDAVGNYAPNPKNTIKDSLSVAIGFTAVPANF